VLLDPLARIAALAQDNWTASRNNNKRYVSYGLILVLPPPPRPPPVYRATRRGGMRIRSGAIGDRQTGSKLGFCSRPRGDETSRKALRLLSCHPSSLSLSLSLSLSFSFSLEGREKITPGTSERRSHAESAARYEAARRKLHGSLSLGWYLVVRRDARRLIYIVQEGIAHPGSRR